jgi:hypothetical protein
VDGDNVYVLWSKTVEDNDTSSAAAPSLDTKTQLLLARSTDGGSTFSRPVMVTDKGGVSGPLRLDVSINNTIHVAWKQDSLEETETEGIMKILSSRILLAKSTDGGTTFSEPVDIIESESSIDSDFNIGSSGNNVYAVWSMDTGGGGVPGEHIFATKSTDGGTTFNEVPIEVANGRFPDMAVSNNNNNWYVTWLYNIGNAEIFFTKIPVNQSSSQLTNRSILETIGGNAVDAADLAPTPEEQKDTFLAYENPNYGIKIEYPANWERDDTSRTFRNLAVVVSFHSPLGLDSIDNFQENLNIVRSYPLPIGANTLEAFATTNVKEVTGGFENATLDRLTSITLKSNNNSQAMQAEYTNRIHGLVLKQMQIYTIEGDKGYVITYTAEASKYAAYLPIIQKMLDSFEIVPSSSITEGQRDGRETNVPLQSLTTDTDPGNKTMTAGDISLEGQQPVVKDGSLAVSIETADDPIRLGLQQTVVVTAEDKTTKEKIEGANVIGEVIFKSSNNIVERFSGNTGSAGQVSHRWTIGDATYDPGRYNIRIQVSAEGYRPTSASTMFEVD